MEFILHVFRLYPNLISNFVQGAVYLGSGILLFHAFWLLIQAFRHTKLVTADNLTREMKKVSQINDPLMVMAAKTLYSAHKEHEGNSYFLVDATHQLIESLFLSKYINKVTMITNLLPPMGFIGTIFGMIMIFLAKGDPNSDLNTSGLGAALFTTLMALTCFVLIEVVKKSVINLAEARINKALGVALDSL